MRIIQLEASAVAITGGHAYNKKLLLALSESAQCQFEQIAPVRSRYAGLKRYFAPLLEIGMIKRFKKGDIVFFGDSSLRFHLPLMLITALLKRSVQTIVIIHHFPYLSESGFKRKLARNLEHLYFGLAKHIIVPSPYTKELAEQMLDASKVSYIPLPLNNSYQPSENYQKGRLLFVGTIENRKGLIYLLDAASGLRKKGLKFHIDVAGKVVDESYNRQLHTFIHQNELEKSVTFHGRVSDNELQQLYRNAELFVFPSLLEGYGIVLVEAMQHGLPIIAFDNSAMPYTVKDGKNGKLVTNKDSQALANAIEGFLSGKISREAMQPAIRETLAGIKTEKDFDMAAKSFADLIF